MAASARTDTRIFPLAPSDRFCMICPRLEVAGEVTSSVSSRHSRNLGTMRWPRSMLPPSSSRQGSCPPRDTRTALFGCVPGRRNRLRSALAGSVSISERARGQETFIWRFEISEVPLQGLEMNVYLPSHVREVPRGSQRGV